MMTIVLIINRTATMPIAAQIYQGILITPDEKNL